MSKDDVRTVIANGPVVFVVDDDEPMRLAIDSLLRSVGLEVRLFASAAELLQQGLPDILGCLILDVRLKEISGLQFQNQLQQLGFRLPIIFLTGYGDVAMTVRAMKAGAVDFLTKPFREQDLLDAVASALEKERERRSIMCSDKEIIERYETLSIREKEVMSLAVAGLMNKQIASELNLSEITVKIHRGHAMKKMHARSFADLVRMSEKIRQRVEL
jgi:FixJ family two-component response regulator